MGDVITQSKAEVGGTLVEALVALVILGMAAASIFPVFVISARTQRFGDARLSCEAVVKQKLESYLTGKSLNLSAEHTSMHGGLGGSSIAALSIPTFLDHSYVKLAGVPTNEVLRRSTSSPFDYAKFRYNRFSSSSPTTKASICSGSAILSGAYPGITGIDNDIKNWGVRECIGSDGVWGESTAGIKNGLDGSNTPPVCSNALDVATQNIMPGFRLYVRLSRVTPWRSYTIEEGSTLNTDRIGFPVGSNDPYADSVGTNNGSADLVQNQYSSECPRDFIHGPFFSAPYGAQISTLPAAHYAYDFNGVGDGIEITVSGFIDHQTLGLQNYLGVSDPERMMCQAKGVVYPNRFPFRYYLSESGEIFETNENNGALGAATQEFEPKAVFRSVQYGAAFANPQTPGAVADGSIKSFAVHPLNYSIYILKDDTILRYSLCGGIPIDCSTGAVVAFGVSDDGIDQRSTIQTWSLNGTGISQIAVDFKTGRVFGLLGNGKEVVEILNEAGVAPNDKLRDESSTTNIARIVNIDPLKYGDMYLMDPAYLPNLYSAAGITQTWDDLPEKFGFFIASDGEIAYLSSKIVHGVLGEATAIYQNGAAMRRPSYIFPGSAKSFSP